MNLCTHTVFITSLCKFNSKISERLKSLSSFTAERSCEVSEDRCAQSARRSGGLHL